MSKIEPAGEAGNATSTSLLPDKHPQHDLFICDVADAVLKDMMQHLEHPFYSLSKTPDRKVRRYQHNDQWIEITPSVKGLATIYDKDILIYCISQIMAKMKRGEPVSKRVRINTRELLIFTNRGTSGREYANLLESLDRLEGTRIRTNIITGDEEQTNGFGLIDASAIRRKHGLDGRLLWCDITLSDWVFSAIQAQEVLTLHRDYFRLSKPLERRVYELARKHCGQQSSWRVSLGVLLKKSGSQSPEWRFRKMVRELAASNHLPDYFVEYEDAADMVTFLNRGTVRGQGEQSSEPWDGVLDPDTFEKARKVAGGLDVYVLEQKWRAWVGKAKVNLRSPDRNFIDFCQKQGARHQSSA